MKYVFNDGFNEQIRDDKRRTISYLQRKLEWCFNNLHPFCSRSTIQATIEVDTNKNRKHQACKGEGIMHQGAVLEECTEEDTIT